MMPGLVIFVFVLVWLLSFGYFEIIDRITPSFFIEATGFFMWGLILVIMGLIIELKGDKK